MSEEVCDMFETDLCRHYQKKKTCHYKTTHNVKCPVEMLNELIRIYTYASDSVQSSNKSKTEVEK